MFYLSIDVEASGPFPGLHDLVSIGAVVVREDYGAWQVDDARNFYVELQPQGGEVLSAATDIHGLTPDVLQQRGIPPQAAMSQFADWCQQQKEAFGSFKAAAWPISFDLPFIGWLAQKYLGTNPLGHSGFDIASYGMGLLCCSNKDQLEFRMAEAGYEEAQNDNPHNALSDAVAQAQMLVWMLNQADYRVIGGME